MPKFAVMTFMFKNWITSGKMDYPTMLGGFAKAGVQGLEPFHRDFVETPSLLAEYRRLADDLGMAVPVVDIIANLASPDAATMQEGRDQLKRGLDICKALGSEIAHVAGHRATEGEDPAEGRKRIAEELVAAADLARSYGLVLAIEDFDPSPTLVCSAADCLEILEHSGGVVQFVFDTGNFLAVGEQPDEVFAQLADRICHVHFKDAAKDPESPKGYRWVAMGEGFVRNDKVAKMLNAQGHNGWVALETFGRNDVDPVTVVRNELPVVKGWFA